MEIIKTQKEKITTLTRDNVEELHTILSTNYTILENIDPIIPPGIKDENLLESAVFRQHTGSGEWYKYDNSFSNCATLVFGIIKDHAFHNGNKRTGLLCMIKHLYLNGYVLKPNLKHEDIYGFILAISADDLHSFANKNVTYRRWLRINKLQRKESINIEQQLEFIEYWLRINSVSKIVQLKSNVKILKLRNILLKKGIILEQSGSRIKIYKLIDVKILGIKAGTKIICEKEYSLGNSLNEIGNATLKYIRRDFSLTQNDGFDNIVFYDDDYFIDEEVTKYKKLIYRLSKV